MDRSIVCGVDGSADSQAALAVAGDLAARLRLRLIMANVVEPSHAPTSAPPPSEESCRVRHFRATEQQEEAGTGYSSNSARQWDSNRQTNASSSATQPSGLPTSPTRKELK